MRFSGHVLGNIFVVFLSSACRETAKHVIKKSKGANDRGKFFLSTFLAKKITWIIPKSFMVFLNFPC
jgi:hypothetical protein